MENMEQNAPSVSVIIPVYNCAPYLRQCIDSVINQTEPSWEILCVDDGSTDDSISILREFEEKLCGKMRVFVQENSGPAKARNRAIDLARGKYLLFLDADDFIDCRCIELAKERAEEISADLVAWDVWYFNDRYQRLQHPPVGMLHFAPFEKGGESSSWRDSPDDIFISFQNWPWNKLFSTQFVRAEGLRFQEDVKRTEDVAFVCAALVKASSIGLLYDRLSYYRVMRPGSAMATKDSYRFDFLKAFEWLRGFLEREGLFAEVERSYANWALSSVLHNLHTLNTYEAYEDVFGALHSGWLEKLDLVGHDKGYFFNEGAYAALEDIGSLSSSRYLFKRMRILDGALDDSAAILDFARMDRDEKARNLLETENRMASLGQEILVLKQDIERKRSSRVFRLAEKYVNRVDEVE